LSPEKARFGAAPVPDPEELGLDAAVLVLDPHGCNPLGKNTTYAKY